MANTIIHKKSSVPGKVPLPADLVAGELAINTNDGIVYLKTDAGVVTQVSGSGGSGGDADTLDGLDSTQFLRADIDDAHTGAILTANHFHSSGKTLTFAFENGNEKDTTDVTISASRGIGYAEAVIRYDETDEKWKLEGHQNTSTANEIWHAGNMGSGSTLDADLLDGQEGTHYLDYNNFTNTPSGVSTFIGTGIADTQRVATSTILNVNITIPYDNTIPQITEGEEIVSMVYTPKYADSKLLIRGLLQASGKTNSATENIAVCIFDGSANAISVSHASTTPDNAKLMIPVGTTYNVSNTNPITFSMRAGSQTNGFYANASASGTGVYGTALESWLEIIEINTNLPSTGETLQTAYTQYKPAQQDTNIIQGDTLASISFTPKSSNSTLLVDFSTLIYLNVDSESVTFRIYENGVEVPSTGDIGRYWVLGGQVLGASGSKVQYTNSSTATRTIEIKASAVTGVPSQRNEGYTSLTVTEIQN